MLRRTSAVLLAALLGAAIMVSSVSAATGAGKQAGRRGFAARQAPLTAFSRALSLTPEQTQQVSVILQRLRTDVRGVAASNRTPQEKRIAVLQLRASAKDNIRSLLIIDQRNKADERRLIDKLLSPRRHHGGMMRVLARLNLSPNQKTRVQSILRDSGTKTRAVRTDTSLTPEAKRARMMEIRRGTIDSISAVLKPDQRTKFQQWVNSKRGMRR